MSERSQYRHSRDKPPPLRKCRDPIMTHRSRFARRMIVPLQLAQEKFRFNCERIFVGNFNHGRPSQ